MGLIFEGSFGSTGDFCMPKNSPFGIQSKTDYNFQCVKSHREFYTLKVVIYALSMFINYPNYMHRIQNVSPGLIFRRISELVYRRDNIQGKLIFRIIL